MVIAAMKIRHLLLGRKVVTNLDSVFKSITLPTKVHIVKAMFFSSSHVQTLELDHKEGFAEELMLSNCGAGEGS